MIRLENIRIFKRVAELGSFSAAAKEFDLTQPSVSKAIKGLEKDLGVNLLRRTTRGLSLTGEGQKLLFGGSSLLEQAEVLFASVRNERTQLTGQLRIATSIAFARVVLAPIIERFIDLHPGLKLSFHLSDGTIDLVESGIDLAVRIGEPRDSTLRARKVGSSLRCLYASKDYLKKNGRPKSVEDLRSHRLLYYTRIADRPSWPLNSKDGRAETFYFEPFLQTDGSDFMRQMVLDGMGIALMPSWMMTEPEKQKLVVRLFEDRTTAQLPVLALTANGLNQSAKQKAFTDFLIQVFDKYPSLSLR